MNNKKKMPVLLAIILSVLVVSVAALLFILPSCGDSEGTDPPCEEHSWHEVGRDEPSCEGVGRIFYTCALCLESKSEDISPLGHDWQQDSIEYNCDNGDYIIYSCTGCGMTKDETTAPRGHKFVELERTESTCSSQGYIYYECELCDSGNYTYFDTVDHTWQIEFQHEGDCKSEGYVYYRCSECFDVDERSTGFGTHSWYGSSTADCGDEGYFERHCQTCGLEENGSTLMLSHDFINKPGQAPTCYNNGWKDYKECARCGNNDYEIIAATDHPSAKWVVTHTPTATTKGVRELHCDDCGDDFRVEVPESIYTDGLIYEFDSGKYIVIGIDRRVNPTATTIAVPMTYMGVPIRAISENAFKGDTSIKALDLSRSQITSIGASAFKDCTELTSLSLSPHSTDIEDYAFSGCTALSDVSGEGYICSIGTEAFISTAITELDLSGYIVLIGERAFKDSKLTSLTLSGSISKISISAFAGAGEGALVISGYIDLIDEEAFIDSGFTSVTISGSVRTASIDSFRNIAATSLEISGTVTSLGSNAFMGSKLTTLTISEGGRITQLGPSAFADLPLTSIDLSGSIETIEAEAFRGAKITSLDIRGSIGSLGYNAFGGSTLESFVITGQVNAIGTGAFNNCTSLKTVDIGESVNYLGYAFLGGCTAVTDLIIPFIGTENDSADDAETYILADVFGRSLDGTYSYVLVNGASVPSSLKNLIITSDEYVSPSLIVGCKDLETILLPEDMYLAEGLMIEGCDSLICNEYDNGLYLGTPSNPYIAFVGVKDPESYTCIINDRTVVISQKSFMTSKVSDLVIPSSVFYIGTQAFWRNTYIKTVTMDNSVGVIGTEAFRECSCLREVDVSDKLTVIGTRAFAECSSLQSFTIPYYMSRIGYEAFLYCTSMERVYFARPYGWRAGSHTFGEYVSGTTSNGGAELSYVLSNPEKAAMNLRGSYLRQVWEFYPSLAD